MKTQEELNALKEEVVTLNEKLHELTEEEFAQVTGGVFPDKRGEGKKPGIEAPPNGVPGFNLQ